MLSFQAQPSVADLRDENKMIAPEVLLERADRIKSLHQASFNLSQKNPIRPERLRNMHVNRPGFGSHVCLKAMTEERRALKAINF